MFGMLLAIEQQDATPWVCELCGRVAGSGDDYCGWCAFEWETDLTRASPGPYVRDGQPTRVAAVTVVPGGGGSSIIHRTARDE